MMLRCSVLIWVVLVGVLLQLLWIQLFPVDEVDDIVHNNDIASLPKEIQDWQQQGRFIDCFGMRIFVNEISKGTCIVY